MCLAVAMKLIEIDGRRGKAAKGSVTVSVRLDLIEAPVLNEYYLIHAGFAVQRLDAEEAVASLAWLDAARQGGPGSGADGG